MGRKLELHAGHCGDSELLLRQTVMVWGMAWWLFIYQCFFFKGGLYYLLFLFSTM